MSLSSPKITRRKPKPSPSPQRSEPVRVLPAPKETRYGKTPSGVLFQVPTTHSFFHSILSPTSTKSVFQIGTLATLALQLLTFFSLLSYGKISWIRWGFLVYFSFWRLSYDLGLGWILRKQSEKKWIVRNATEIIKKPEGKRWWNWAGKEMSKTMDEDYQFENLPIEYNVWLLFRHVVDLILLNDFVSYCLFAFSCMHFNPSHSTALHVLRWGAGWTLVAFNFWVKTDAHRIVKDFAWYWGDAFFLSMDTLIFDGVFEMAPHPMYSVGYAGYYGLSLITGSQLVFFVSLAAHLCQFGFLIWFENPHIERTYGSKKPLASRIPLRLQNSAALDSSDSKSTSDKASTEDTSSVMSSPRLTNNKRLTRPSSVSWNSGFSDFEAPGEASSTSFTTPFATETDTEAEIETVTEAEEEVEKEKVQRPASPLMARKGLAMKREKSSSGPSRREPLSRHDLDHKYFVKDLLVLRNLDVLRSQDLSLLVLITYSISISLVSSSPVVLRSFLIGSTIFWRIFLSFGLGFALRAQSNSKWVVRHWLKNYGSKDAVEEAFKNWKGVYNMVLVMTYTSFAVLAAKEYRIPHDWTISSEVLRHTFGLLLIGLHVYTAHSTYEVLGNFGWFYGDFFIEEYPVSLAYTGIYRFLNNPERSMGCAAFFGLTMISGSKTLLALSIFSVLSHWWFLSKVENPHMKKLYGNAIRKEAGLTKTIKTVAKRNVETRAPRLSQVVKEVQGTIEKVTKETTELLDEFLEKSTPKISNYVEGTKLLIQQSGERLLITRMANVSSLDSSKYHVSIQPPKSTPTSSTSKISTTLKFQLGEPIVIKWTAPKTHSRQDWIGIYHTKSNRSRLVTRVASSGRWLGVCDEWEGDNFVEKKDDSKTEDSTHTEGSYDGDAGVLIFSGKKLPWAEGTYELRYHHAGKYNVMALSEAFQVYVDKPANMDSIDSIQASLLQTVTFALDLDPSITPQTSRRIIETYSLPSNDNDPKEVSKVETVDPEDFTIMSEEQAAMISQGIKMTFDVDLGPDVVIADANVSKLAETVWEARRLLKPFSSTEIQDRSKKED